MQEYLGFKESAWANEFSLLPIIVQISSMITLRTGIQSGGHAVVEDQGSKLKPKLVQIIVKEGRMLEDEGGQEEMSQQEEKKLKLDGRSRS